MFQKLYRRWLSYQKGFDSRRIFSPFLWEGTRKSSLVNMEQCSSYDTLHSMSRIIKRTLSEGIVRHIIIFKPICNVNSFQFPRCSWFNSLWRFIRSVHKANYLLINSFSYFQLLVKLNSIWIKNVSEVNEILLYTVKVKTLPKYCQTVRIKFILYTERDSRLQSCFGLKLSPALNQVFNFDNQNYFYFLRKKVISIAPPYLLQIYEVKNRIRMVHEFIFEV